MTLGFSPNPSVEFQGEDDQKDTPQRVGTYL